MHPPGAVHAACLAMVVLPASHGTQPQPNSSGIAGCAFCGGHAIPFRSKRLSITTSRSSVASNRPPSCSPLSQGCGGSSNACRGKICPLVAAARRWDGEEDEGGSGDERRSGRRRPLRAPWEDIQWSNSDANSKRRRVGWEEDEDDEDDEEEVLGLGERQRGRIQPRVYR